MPRTIHFQTRYIRLYAPPGQEHSEENYGYAYEQWELPVESCAVLCIDCWNWTHAANSLRRVDQISRQHIGPLLGACRRGGLQIIHAPANPPGKSHPNYVGREKAEVKAPAPATWPPAEFVQRRGAYATIPNPVAAVNDPERIRKRNAIDFHECARPVGDEPVVLRLDELQEFCEEKQILHLFFVGFFTNACLALREYGIPAMRRKGYNCFLIRDCTVGMESAPTLSDMACTRGAINSYEQFLASTLEARELITALG